MKYRKKPVIIEAIQFIATPTIFQYQPPMWMNKALLDGTVYYVDGVLKIKTLEGIMTAEPNDWIIQGVKGEIYSCKPDVFEVTYEKVEE